MKTLEKGFLALNLIIYAGFVAAAYLAPVWLGNQLGIHLGGTTALADFRAMYGGLPLAASVVFVLGIERDELRRAAIWLATAGALGLLVGRLLTLVQAGPAGLYIYASMGSEMVAVVAGAFLLRARSMCRSESAMRFSRPRGTPRPTGRPPCTRRRCSRCGKRFPFCSRPRSRSARWSSIGAGTW